METQKHGRGLQTLFEHGWLASVAIVVGLASMILDFFTNLNGTPWMWFGTMSMALMVSGASLIGYAKCPSYRKGRFLTFGPNSVPDRLRRLYGWGWLLFLAGVAVSLCLQLSRL